MKRVRVSPERTGATSRTSGFRSLDLSFRPIPQGLKFQGSGITPECRKALGWLPVTSQLQSAARTKAEGGGGGGGLPPALRKYELPIEIRTPVASPLPGSSGSTTAATHARGPAQCSEVRNRSPALLEGPVRRLRVFRLWVCFAGFTKGIEQPFPLQPSS